MSEGFSIRRRRQLDPQEIGRRGRIGYALHSRSEPHATAARAGLQRRFEREVDPDGTLPPHERARLVAEARRRFYNANSRGERVSPRAPP